MRQLGGCCRCWISPGNLADKELVEAIVVGHYALYAYGIAVLILTKREWGGVTNVKYSSILGFDDIDVSLPVKYPLDVNVYLIYFELAPVELRNEIA